jgi:hypothetical protein
MTGTEVGEGFVSSDRVDGKDAAVKLVQKTCRDGGFFDADFAFLFCSDAFDLNRFISALDNLLTERGVEWIGCTTAGEISSEGSTLGGAVLIMINTEEIEFYTSVVDGAYEDPLGAGQKAGRKINAKMILESSLHKVLFTLMPGFTEEQLGVEFEILRGLTDELHPDLPIVGGSAGDDLDFETTHQFVNGDIYDDALIVTAIESEMPIVTGQEHGLSRKIKSGVVSEADGRTIHTISGRPAAEFYADIIGVDVAELKKERETSLSQKISESIREVFLSAKGKDPNKVQKVMEYALEKSLAEEVTPTDLRILTPLHVTEDNGLVMTSDIDENRPIHVVEGERNDIVWAAREAFSHVDPEKDVPLFGIIADCTCRNQLLNGKERQKEIRLLRDYLGSPIGGFYGYGEIGGKGEHITTYQNQTVSGFVVLGRMEQIEEDEE